jgi:predicted  nucleic acid-binding Zn-ribbon protein
MAVKWLNKILGKQNQQKPRTTDTVAFHDLGGWVSDRTRAELGGFFESAAQIFAEIKGAKEELIRDIKTLESAEPPELPSRVLRVGFAARDSMIKQINVMIDRISTPAMDYPAIMEFCRSVDTALDATIEKSAKSHHRAKYLFPKEVGAVFTDLRNIKISLAKLRDLLDREGAKIKGFDEITGTIQRIDDIKRDIVAGNSNIKKNSSKTDEIKREISDCTTKLEQLSQSKEWSSFVELEDRLKEREVEANNIESNVTELFIPLNKALNRMKKQSESGRYTLSKKQKELLDVCLENPISADAADVNDFLTEMLQIVESGALGLKDKKRDKIIDQIDQIMDSFAPKKERYDALKSETREIEHQISDLTISKTKTALEGQLTEKNGKIAQIDEDLVNLGAELRMRSEELEDRKAELSDAVNSIEPVQIVFD